jgi:hypothetical protein
MQSNYKVGDKVDLVYDRSSEGRLRCEVVSSQGGWITLAPTNHPRNNDHYIRVCETTGMDRYGGRIEPAQGAS